MVFIGATALLSFRGRDQFERILEVGDGDIMSLKDDTRKLFAYDFVRAQEAKEPSVCIHFRKLTSEVKSNIDIYEQVVNGQREIESLEKQFNDYKMQKRQKSENLGIS